MSIVPLVSGGLDSTLVAYLAKEEGIQQFPLFVDYGQRSRDRELAACRSAMAKLQLPDLKVADLSGYGRLIKSGLTDPNQRVLEDAFTPGRNLLFLLVAAAYAFQRDADAIVLTHACFRKCAIRSLMACVQRSRNRAKAGEYVPAQRRNQLRSRGPGSSRIELYGRNRALHRCRAGHLDAFTLSHARR